MSDDTGGRRGPSWWVQVAIGTLATVSLGVGAYVATNLIAMRVEIARHGDEIERTKNDVARIQGQVATLPTSKDFDRLSIDINNLRSDLREARSALERKR